MEQKNHDSKALKIIKNISGVIMVFYLIYEDVHLGNEVEPYIWFIAALIMGVDFKGLKDIFTK